MAATAPKRSRPRAPVPPARRLSTPKPTIVDVNTVVDSSWIPNWRALECCRPKIAPRTPIVMSFVSLS